MTKSNHQFWPVAIRLRFSFHGKAYHVCNDGLVSSQSPSPYCKDCPHSKIKQGAWPHCILGVHGACVVEDDVHAALGTDVGHRGLDVGFYGHVVGECAPDAGDACSALWQRLSEKVCSGHRREIEASALLTSHQSLDQV